MTINSHYFKGVYFGENMCRQRNYRYLLSYWTPVSVAKWIGWAESTLFNNYYKSKKHCAELSLYNSVSTASYVIRFLLYEL